jgi:FecR protein
MGARATFTGTAAIAAISLMLPAAAPAQSPRAGVVTTLQGTATVARTSAPEPAPLKFRDDVFVQDRITTGDESIARILLGGKAVVTIRERSKLTITETPTTSTIEIASGKIALSVNKDRVKPGESVEIKTPNAVAAIRGTIIVAEVDTPTGRPADASTRFTLLTGVVDVTRLDHTTGRTSGPVVVMKPMQTLGLTGFSALSAPRPITRVEGDAVASSFTVKLPEPVPGVNAKVVDDQVKEATRRISNEPIKDKDKVDKSRSGKGTDDGGDRGGSAAGGVSAAGGGSAASGGSAVGGSSLTGGGSAVSGGSAASGGSAVGGGTLVSGGSLTGGGSVAGGNGNSGKVGGGIRIGGDDLRGKERVKDRLR